MAVTRLVLAMVIFLVSRSAFTEDIRDLTLDQLRQLAQEVSQARIGDVTDEDVKYFLFTRTCPFSVRINQTGTPIDKTKPTKFIIHGWIANSRRSWTKGMTNEFLKNDDFNVIIVDWERLARTSYTSAAKDTKEIGHMIAQFIINVQLLPVEKVHLIGHSLGAHIAGFAAKKIMGELGKKVGRISGLDPAGPVFARHISVTKERLDKNDATVVDIIHTDAGASGIAYPIGTLDIFVNGGIARQPGCIENVGVTSVGGFLEHSYCSHEMSITYFIEWINNGKFRCILCSSWQNSLTGRCGKRLSIGEADVDQNIIGICLTKVRRRRPYLIK